MATGLCPGPAQFVNYARVAGTGCQLSQYHEHHHDGRNGLLGRAVDSLQINTAAIPPDNIEFVRFDSLQINPYKGHGGTSLGEETAINGKATIRNVSFPSNSGTTDQLYYVYACLKPEPGDTNCAPFALIKVFIKANPVANLLV